MNKELDLSGLKLVYGGLILQIISALFSGRLATGLMSGTALAGIVSPVIHVISLCIVLAGVSRLGAASPFFTRAKIPFLIQLIVQIILIVILCVLAGREWSVNSITQTDRGAVIGMLIGLLAVLAVSVLSTLAGVKSLLRGCGHVAEQVNDPLFSLKCMKSWRLWYMAFLLTILMILAGVAMIVTVLRKTMEAGTAGEDLSQAIFTNVTSSALLVSIIVLVVLIFFLIVHILFIGKIRHTYREYHLEEVKTDGNGTARPVFADYIRRELGSAAETVQDASETEEEAGDYPGMTGEEQEETEPAEDGEVYSDAAGETGNRTISGRRYRRITEEEDPEEEHDPEEILEIAKLFKKKK